MKLHKNELVIKTSNLLKAAEILGYVYAKMINLQEAYIDRDGVHCVFKELYLKDLDWINAQIEVIRIKFGFDGIEWRFAR